jgi:hypothetical protein
MTRRITQSLTFDVGDARVLDPNEVFAHADQFKFESGIFENSTEIYLLATRGRTTIQFTFDHRSKTLKLRRVIYDNPKGFEKKEGGKVQDAP